MINKYIVGIVVILLTTTFVISGCVETETPTESETQSEPEQSISETQGNSNSVKTITISGVDKTQEISDSVPIKLVISGVRNTIMVKENTQVDEIIVSGTDITIYLPQGSSPKVTDGGIRTKIIYY